MASSSRKAHLITNDRNVGIAVLRMTEVKVRFSLRTVARVNILLVSSKLKPALQTNRNFRLVSPCI
jgi:hypothetical protein